MIDGIPLSVGEMSGWALFVVLCILVVVSLMRGWIVPGATARMFQTAWEKSKESSDKKDEIIIELLPLARTTVDLLEALQNSREAKK